MICPSLNTFFLWQMFFLWVQIKNISNVKGYMNEAFNEMKLVYF